MKKPKKAKGKRTRITTKNPPGGPRTPGAKAKINRAKRAAKKKK